MKWDVATAFSRGVDSQWKNYTKANFLAYDKQDSTAGQVQGLKGSGFQIKTVCTFREMVWKSLLGQPQIKQSCQALFMKISKHQLSVVPHQQGHAAFVAPICRIWSYSSCRQWEGKKKISEKTCSEFPLSVRMQQAQIWPASSEPFYTTARTACLTKPVHKLLCLLTHLRGRLFISPSPREHSSDGLASPPHLSEGAALHTAVPDACCWPLLLDGGQMTATNWLFGKASYKQVQM